jgi:hypothetical protein
MPAQLLVWLLQTSFGTSVGAQHLSLHSNNGSKWGGRIRWKKENINAEIKMVKVICVGEYFLTYVIPLCCEGKLRIVVSGPCPSREGIVDVFLQRNGVRTLVKIWLWTPGSDNNSSYQVYGVYCEQVTKLQGGRELRLSVMCPRGDLVVLTVRRLVEKCSILC